MGLWLAEKLAISLVISHTCLLFSPVHPLRRNSPVRQDQGDSSSLCSYHTKIHKASLITMQSKCKSLSSSLPLRTNEISCYHELLLLAYVTSCSTSCADVIRALCRLTVWVSKCRESNMTSGWKWHKYPPGELSPLIGLGSFHLQM